MKSKSDCSITAAHEGLCIRWSRKRAVHNTKQEQEKEEDNMKWWTQKGK